MTGPVFTAQPLGAGGRPLVIDRLSVAWARWRGVSLVSVTELAVEMSKDVRRRPWSVETQIARIVHGRMVPELDGLDTDDDLEMVLVGVKATIGVRMSEDVVLARSAVRISIGVPDSYVAALPGRPLSTVVAMPFPFDAVIDQVTRNDDSLVVTLRDPWMELPIRD